MNTATLETSITQTPLPKVKSDWSWLYDSVDRIGPGQRLTATGANWSIYQNVMARRDAMRPGMRIQYDRGEIHIMPTSFLHELLKSLLAQLLEVIFVELKIDMIPAGGMTVSQEDMDRGFEPDECFYVQSFRRVLGKEKLDFQKDPPPDLIIEIEITSSVSTRLPIFAAFRVPEVWRYDGKSLTVLHLMPDGRYEPMSDSLAIPGFPFADLPKFLSQSGKVSNTAILREFQQWVRENLVSQS